MSTTNNSPKFQKTPSSLTPKSEILTPSRTKSVQQSQEYREWLAGMIKEYYKNNPDSLLRDSLTDEGKNSNL